jgi:hypothetical protein
MRRHHERVWTEILIEAKIMVQEKIQQVSIIVGLALREEKSAHHGFAIRTDDRETMLSVPYRSPSTALRIATHRSRRLDFGVEILKS